MSAFVVDASVVIKWFIPEPDASLAAGWLHANHDYFAPDLLFPELGNVIWKKVARKELSASDGARLIEDLTPLAVETVSTRPLLGDAYTLARTLDITVYDASYLALAVRLRSQMVTADRRLIRAARQHASVAAHIRDLADLA